MILLVQSNILGDTIESSCLHMGDSSEILFNGEEPSPIRDYSFTPMVTIIPRQESIQQKETKKERGFETRENKSEATMGICGGRESLNVHNGENTVLLRCKGGLSGMTGNLLIGAVHQ